MEQLSKGTVETMTFTRS